MMLPLKERSILLGIPLDQGDEQGNYSGGHILN